MASRKVSAGSRRRSNSRSLVVAGLFAGVGGFEQAFAEEGHETALLCEIDDAARAVLRARFPGVALVRDVRNIECLPAAVNTICAGFPCQDLSSTGQKDGIGGQQSSLIEEVFRLLKRRSVDWLVLENVPFMLQLKKGQAIRRIADSLEELGYSWAYRVIDSRAFGVPQRRRRVFIVASRSGDPRNVLLADNARRNRPFMPSGAVALQRPIGFYWTEGTFATGLAYDSVPPIKGGSTIGIPSPPAVLLTDGEIVTPHICDAERLQGFSAGWTEPAEAAHRASVRWKLVGNAVTVSAAQWIAECLTNPGLYEDKGDLPLPAEGSWPNAAWSLREGRYMSSVSQFPIPGRWVSLARFLRFPGRPLSAKATNGFLTRASAGGLRFPGGFLAAVEAHAARMA